MNLSPKKVCSRKGVNGRAELLPATKYLVLALFLLFWFAGNYYIALPSPSANLFSFWLGWQVDWEEADPADNAEGSDDILENLRRNFIATLNQAGDQVSRGQRCADG